MDDLNVNNTLKMPKMFVVQTTLKVFLNSKEDI